MWATLLTSWNTARPLDFATRRASAALVSFFVLCGIGDAQVAAPTLDRTVAGELPVRLVPNLGPAAEFYFAPDSQHIIGTAKREGDASYHIYTLQIDGTEIRRINAAGEDACSYYFPDGRHLVWTSTRDHLDLPKGNFSSPTDYPKSAELYSSDLDGSHVKRLTNNLYYDAEVSVSSDGRKVLFGRQVNGKMELWKMRPDGSHQTQITHLNGWEPGGAFYLNDNKTILFRAWKSTDQNATKGSLPMTLFTIRDDGDGLKQLTHDTGTNWAPFPAPDGRHFVFVKVLEGHQYQIFLGDLESDETKQLTFSKGFNGFPVISPDGAKLLFASSRDSKPNARLLTLYIEDISSLGIGPKEHKGG